MKQVFIGLFAHPDDESFGPSGSLMQYIAAGADVHLICATKGQSGRDAVGTSDLAVLREQEWRAAGQKIGAKSMQCLGFKDGELSNNQFHLIAKKCEQMISEIAGLYPKNTEINLLTMDQNGITGHIDHTVMSNVTSYIFIRLRQKDNRFNTVFYYCLSEHQAAKANCDFVFMPKGRALHDIDITNDISDVYEDKKELMRLHASQAEDIEKTIAEFEKIPEKLEHFYLFKD
jgi:LmbE family N-acetylglucosaminyl deacetylase